MIKTFISKNGQILGTIRIKYIITHAHIEMAIIGLLANGDEKVSKKKITEELDNMFYSGGLDAWASWCTEDAQEQYSDMAKELGLKYFPIFYKTIQQ